MLKLDNIEKSYLSGESTVNALKGVSLEFRNSEFVSILGPSGCGKTSMLNIIGGLDRYTSGDLVIDGKSTTEFRDRDWDAYRNHTVGFVFQSYNLIGHQTVLDNVAIALTLSGIGVRERKRRALEALESVGIADQAKKKPNQLSGGQMQRVAIARALVNNPKIILADEPTGALDSTTSVQIMSILKDISKDHLVVMVTHNKELAEEYSTRIIKLKDGDIIEDTNPYKGKEKKEQEGLEEKKLKTSMSYLTALKLSFKNLLTKKTRTILTAVAGSIGIIGVAIILSISHGMNLYIDRMQREMLASVPIDIGRIAFSFNEQTEHSGGDYVRPSERWVRPHLNFISDEFLEFVDYYITRHAYAVTRTYETTLNVMFQPEGSSEPPTRLGGRGQITDPGALVNLFELPHESLVTNPDFFTTVASDPNLEGSNVIPLTLLLNSQNQVDSNLLNLVFPARQTVPFDEILGTKFYLVHNSAKSMFEFSNGRFEFGNFSEVLDDSEYYEVMKITRIIKPASGQVGMFVGGTGLCFPQDLRRRIAHENSSCFYDDVLIELIPRMSAFLSGIGIDPSDFTTFPTTEAAFISLVNTMNTSAEPILNVLGDIAGTGTLSAFDFANQPIQVQLGIQAASIGLDLHYDDHDPVVSEFVKFFDYLAASYRDLAPMFEVLLGELAGFISPLFMRVPSRTAGVSIYAETFEAKTFIQSELERWNIENQHNEIHWNDFVEMFLNVLREIIDAVAIVLIAISAVSLVVSTLMIGIITYVSVLERTKEIGMLRAIGARKKDIRRVFSAETVLIGLAAGVIGISVALLLTIPINLIVGSLTGVQGVAVVPVWGAFGLIAISCALTWVSGLIPSRLAAKKDPVVALRTE